MPHRWMNAGPVMIKISMFDVVATKLVEPAALCCVLTNRACNNIPTMHYFTGISGNTQSKLYYATID